MDCQDFPISSCAGTADASQTECLVLGAAEQASLTLLCCWLAPSALYEYTLALLKLPAHSPQIMPRVPVLIPQLEAQQ